jgi:ammonia channel protein AmtB
MNHLLITFKILFTVVAPLLVLYLGGTWKQQKMVACMSTIPILWYFVYAPIHELSHLPGAYLVGARIVEVKLIPRFWAGETAVAWIKSEGFTNEWSQLIMSCYSSIS